MSVLPDWPILHHATLDSTSDEARRLVQAGARPLPFVVRADRQTRGRGRGSNAWYSDEGSLLVTVALDPAAIGLSTRHEPRLALVAALAVIEATGAIASGIRWPNDVEVGGRKLAGVLPERVETEDGPRLLVGVGINVATRFDRAPAEVRSLAVSLRDLGGPDVDPSAVLDAFLAAFARLLPRLAADDPGLVGRWQALDQLAGRPVRVRQVDRIVEGVGRGIDAEGALRVASTEGEITIVGGQVLR